MCGITGTLDADPSAANARVEWLNGRQAHRGPDHSVEVRAGSFTIGNTRLAILDPSPRGNQPFRSASGRFVCTFNGEIYNYLELIERFDLRDLDTTCDGAIIPALWERLGPACLSLFRGMYGIALVDTAADTLTLARDPFGIKPLYWRRLPGGKIAFSSEPRHLAALEPRAAISQRALTQFFYLGAIPGDASPFEGIEAVPPNAWVQFDSAGSIKHGLVDDSRDPLLGAMQDDATSADAGAVFRESLSVHLRSDVPAALLLSGGVDSTAVACVGQDLGLNLQCLTVEGFGAADETSVAAETARRYGHTHQIVPAVLDEQEVERFFGAMQRPTTDGLNTFIVSAAVKRAGFKVALSGLGADEALGGYRHFKWLRLLPWLQRWDRLPASVTTRLTPLAARVAAVARSDKGRRMLARGGPRTAFDLDLLQREVLPPGVVTRLTGLQPSVQTDDVRAHAGADDAFTQLVRAELYLYMQAMLLPDTDAFSMAHSVEVRVPFVDREFFSVANRLRRSSPKVGHKELLVKALDDPYLTRLASTPKRGFTIPMEQWIRDGLLRGFVAQTMSPDAPLWDYVDIQTGKAIFEGWTESGRWSEVWSLTVANEWIKAVSA